MAHFTINSDNTVDLCDLTLTELAALSNALFAGITHPKASDLSAMRDMQDLISDAYEDLTMEIMSGDPWI